MVRHRHRFLFVFISLNIFQLIIGIVIRDSDISTQLFNHVIHHQFNSNPINTKRIFSIPNSPLYLKPYFKSTPSLYGYGINQPDFSLLTNQVPVDEVHYIVDGRILKQYFVMEDHGEDNSIDAFFNNPFNRNPVTPFLPANFNRVKPVRANLNFANHPIPLNPNLQQRSDGAAIALGSGALGYIRLPNGEIYIGSGSLGYINDQQRSNEIAQIKNRQGHEPSPLTFGHNPN